VKQCWRFLALGLAIRLCEAVFCKPETSRDVEPAS
jgi:hypothetical protein